MDIKTTEAVVKCLEIDCGFYRELMLFLLKKHNKVLKDDLKWLTESLTTEQAYVMKSRSLEEKRTALFEGLGIGNKKLSELVDEAPEDYRAKLKLLGGQLADLVDSIREVNANTSEIVKRKLQNQQQFVKRAGIFNKPETYDRNASKVARGSSSQVIREV